MMAEQNYDVEKYALSSSATPRPMNKKSTLEYMIDPNGPCFPFTLLPKQRATISRGPSPGCELTPLPLKRTDRENTPSPSNFPPLEQAQASLPAQNYGPHHGTRAQCPIHGTPLYTVTPSDPSSWQPIEFSPPKFLC
ncbi:hypothetical protein DSO57_1002050 [Entomophthora muscae]|uniref:Uncharacterized protein n=1 Tax=Entomophthora muscae TaxID=34485 RepID=A0ACC2SAZ7_9FUNG|nr:hypothetical protein DSO57_1002050 [Entomophthora muscae]